MKYNELYVKSQAERYANYAFFIGISMIFFYCVFILIPKMRPYPWSDEWHYLNKDLTISWLFKQSVDHVIPIQKLLQFSLLELSGYDFRILLYFNYVTCILISLILFKIAKIYRGRNVPGDTLIILVVFNLAHGPYHWGFLWTFTSSILFFSLALFFAISYEKSGSFSHYLLLVMAIISCALTGLNGLVLSSFFAFALVVIQFIKIWMSELAKNTALRNVAALLTPIIIIIFLWIMWTPSKISDSAFHLQYANIASYLLGLFQSPFSIFLYGKPLYLIVILGVAVAFFVFIIKLYNYILYSNKMDWPLFILILALISVIALLFAIAIGRSNQSWNLGYSMHYGFLTILLPILPWIIISKILKNRILIHAAMSLILLVLFSLSFHEGFSWQNKYVRTTYPSVIEATFSLSGKLPPNEAAIKDIDSYYFVSSPDTIKIVEKGIIFLRENIKSVFHHKK